MTFDLDVDTDALRRVADLADTMAQGCRSAHPQHPPTMPAGALGDSPLARQVQSRAQQRAVQALQLAEELTTAAAGFASCIRMAVTVFEQVEAIARAGR